MEIRVEIKEIIINVIIPEMHSEPEESLETLIKCSACGWERTYPNAKMAKRGLAAHQRHCPGESEEISRIKRMMDIDAD